MRHLLPVCVLISAVLGAACGAAQPIKNVPVIPAKKVDPATAGTLTGRVTFSGTRPAAELLHINEDPVCRQAFGNKLKSDAVLIGADGSVQNAFVYIKDTLADYAFDVPAEVVTVDQKGCRYIPRVFGVQVGQKVDVTNNDATLHNVHGLPMSNTEFNVGQPEQGMHMTQVFTAPEIMVRFKCDVHSWMAAYGGVIPHPFFAVTKADGTFSISGVPPGQYDLALWHEKLGTSTQKITIGAGQSQAANFTLTASK